MTVSLILTFAGCAKDNPLSRVRVDSAKAIRALVDRTCQAIEIYYVTMGRYPSTEEGLKALIEPPADEKLAEKWKVTGPFLKEGKLPVDLWGNELKYELLLTAAQPGSTGAANGPPYHVWSTGPSGQDGGDDNIRNWDPNGAK